MRFFVRTTFVRLPQNDSFLNRERKWKASERRNNVAGCVSAWKREARQTGVPSVRNYFNKPSVRQLPDSSLNRERKWKASERRNIVAGCVSAWICKARQIGAPSVRDYFGKPSTSVNGASSLNRERKWKKKINSVLRVLVSLWQEVLANP